MTTPANTTPVISSKAFSVEDARAFIAKNASIAAASGTQRPQYTIEQASEYLRATLSRSQEKNCHSFSRRLAKEHGITAAILLKYLAYRITKSAKVHEGRQWHYETIEELAGRYPYLSASAIHETLVRLEPSVLLRSRFNRRSNDKTTWYAFADRAVMEQAGKNVLYFDFNHAATFGIVEAILLHNIQHWVKTNRAKKPFYRYHPMSPAELSAILPISRATIARALAKLVKDGVLEKNPQADGRTPEYALSAAVDPCPTSTSAPPTPDKKVEIKTGNMPLTTGCAKLIPV